MTAPSETPTRDAGQGDAGARGRTARRTRQDFLDAAWQLLDDHGGSSVTTTGLCEALSVTRGSFYHHFVDVEDFVAALLEDWETRGTRERLARVGALDAGPFALGDQLELALSLDHAGERALRIWGATQPAVAAAVGRVDELRLSGFRDLLVDAGMPAPDAQVWADLTVGSLVGLQVMTSPLDLDRLRRLLDEVTRALRQRIPGA